MTLRITDDFTLTRSAASDGRQYLVVEVFGAFPARVRLTLEETKYAAEAFGIMAVMMDSNSYDENESEVLKLEDAA
jgi:hypothetical protein